MSESPEFMTQRRIDEIEEYRESKEIEITSIQPKKLVEFSLDFEDLEEKVREDYLDNLSKTEKKSMKFDAVVNYKDAVYEGGLLDSQRHGLGRILYHSGRWYFGEWRNDKRHGRGIEYHVSGNKYSGEYTIGKAHGIGKMH